MNKPYLILINGTLAARAMTRSGALEIVKAQQAKGISAAVAYELNNGQEAK